MPATKPKKMPPSPKFEASITIHENVCVDIHGETLEEALINARKIKASDLLHTIPVTDNYTVSEPKITLIMEK